MKVEKPGGSNVHNNAFYAEEMLLKSEMQAMRDCNPLTARHWIVRHSNLQFSIASTYWFIYLTSKQHTWP